MGNNKYKLLLLDVDGVLVKSKDAPVPIKVVEAIKRIKTKVHVCLCTGRTKKDLERIIDSLGIGNNFHVIESGAKVLDSKGEEIHVKDISIDEVKRIVSLAGNTPAGYGFCVDGVWHGDMDAIGDGVVTTVSLHSHSQEQTKMILAAIEPIKKEYHVAVGSHWEIPEGSFILITHPDATKGRAIEFVQNKLGIDATETIGVGDMPNDLPLFERSGLKVAMGNGDEELKRKADIIAPGIDEDGVAWVVGEYIR